LKAKSPGCVNPFPPLACLLRGKVTPQEGGRERTQLSRRFSLGNASEASRFSVHAFDDAHVAFARVAEHGERLLVGGAFVSGNSLLNAIELDRNDALSDPFLVSLGRNASSEGPAAVGG